MLFLALGKADWGGPNCPLSQSNEGAGRGWNGAEWVNSEWRTYQAQGWASLGLGRIAQGGRCAGLFPGLFSEVAIPTTGGKMSWEDCE